MIVHIITRLAMGGAQVIVYEIAKRRHKFNKDIIIFTGLSDKVRSLSAQDNKILEIIKKDKIPVEIIPSLNDKISLISDIKSFINIYLLLKKYKPSIVHIHSTKTGILGRLACKLLNLRKVIFHVHGWVFSRSIGFSSNIFFWLEKFFYFLTTNYIFVCKQDMIDFINRGGHFQINIKSHIIYPGINCFEQDKLIRFRNELRNKLGFTDSDHVVGTIGRMDYQKNPQIFVEIASNYYHIDSDAKFLWIGEGVYRNDIKRQIENYGLSKKFKLPGYIHEIDPYFFVFDTFVITSRYEGLPITALKALACGIHVVGFNVNGMNDLSDKFSSVYGVKPFKVQEFVSQLANAKIMMKKGVRITNKDAEYVKKYFNLDLMYENIMKVYDSI